MPQMTNDSLLTLAETHVSQRLNTKVKYCSTVSNLVRETLPHGTVQKESLNKRIKMQRMQNV